MPFQKCLSPPNYLLNAGQNGVFGGKAMGPRISSRFSRPHSNSTSVRAKGNAVPGPRLQENQSIKILCSIEVSEEIPGY